MMDEGIKSARNILAVYKEVHTAARIFEETHKKSLYMTYGERAHLSDEEQQNHREIEREFMRLEHKKALISSFIGYAGHTPDIEAKAILQSLLDCFD